MPSASNRVSALTPDGVRVEMTLTPFPLDTNVDPDRPPYWVADRLSLMVRDTSYHTTFWPAYHEATDVCKQHGMDVYLMGGYSLPLVVIRYDTSLTGNVEALHRRARVQVLMPTMSRQVMILPSQYEIALNPQTGMVAPFILANDLSESVDKKYYGTFGLAKDQAIRYQRKGEHLDGLSILNAYGLWVGEVKPE